MALRMVPICLPNWSDCHTNCPDRAVGLDSVYQAIDSIGGLTCGAAWQAGGVGVISHVPVLLAEAVEQLRIRSDGRYVDGTFGRGGHSREILSQLGPDGGRRAIPAVDRHAGRPR